MTRGLVLQEVWQSGDALSASLYWVNRQTFSRALVCRAGCRRSSTWTKNCCNRWATSSASTAWDASQETVPQLVARQDAAPRRPTHAWGRIAGGI